MGTDLLVNTHLWGCHQKCNIEPKCLSVSLFLKKALILFNGQKEFSGRSGVK